MQGAKILNQPTPEVMVLIKLSNIRPMKEFKLKSTQEEELPIDPEEILDISSNFVFHLEFPICPSQRAEPPGLSRWASARYHRRQPSDPKAREAVEKRRD